MLERELSLPLAFAGQWPLSASSSMRTQLGANRCASGSCATYHLRVGEQWAPRCGASFNSKGSQSAVPNSVGSSARDFSSSDCAKGRFSHECFCHAHGKRVILLLGGYDKGRDPSPRRQKREIASARARLADWSRSRRH